MSSWHSYPSIFNLGHKAVADLLLEPVLVEEKIDGSQFSFGLFMGDDGPFLRCRSKGAELNVIAPEKMFTAAVATVQELAPMLKEGWTYRAEYLVKPKHNALAYDRTPKRYLILFDINSGEEEYLPWEAKEAEAVRLELEVVPYLYHGMVTSVEMIRDLLASTSILGGQKIEGVVVKNYARFGRDKKVLMGKFVSEAYKEVHSAEWKSANLKSGDIIDILIRKYKTPARWAKAVQHLREAGKLEDSPKDIGLLFKEVPEDLKREEADAIKDTLFAWAWSKVQRGATAGIAEWYKDELLKRQFNAGPEA